MNTEQYTQNTAIDIIYTSLLHYTWRYLLRENSSKEYTRTILENIWEKNCKCQQNENITNVIKNTKKVHDKH